MILLKSIIKEESKMFLFIHSGESVIDVILKLLLLILMTYPIIGSLSWFIGVLYYKYLFKHKQTEWIDIPTEIEPMITIMVPAHNEEITINHTINYLMTEMNYSNYEVLVLDDGSTDKTPEILKTLMRKYEKLRVIRIEENKGKAHAFNVGVAFAKGEFILSNDADTVPEPDALWKYINYFIKQESFNIAAVTANMDVKNRTTILGKSQTVEFSSIVGIIKRTQAGVLGSLYAYSGANTMYRKAALIDAGLFRQDRATEDISIAWDHQCKDWLAVFAPDILFYMEVPESLRMLYRQRRRWAKGGTEVWLTNVKLIVQNPFKHIGRTVMFIDQTLSIMWSFVFWLASFLFIVLLLHSLMEGDMERVYRMLTMNAIFVSFEMIAGVLQLGISMIIDNHGKKLKYFLFSPFYMLLFWMMNALTIVTTFIPAIRTILGHGDGTWQSPERQNDGDFVSE